MATITLTNISTESVYVRDLYTTFEPGETIGLVRSLSVLEDMFGIYEHVLQGRMRIDSIVPGPADRDIELLLSQATGDPLANSSGSLLQRGG